jgi:hypothetical protein
MLLDYGILVWIWRLGISETRRRKLPSWFRAGDATDRGGILQPLSSKLRRLRDWVTSLIYSLRRWIRLGAARHVAGRNQAIARNR